MTMLLLDRGRTLVEGTPQEIVAAVPGTLRLLSSHPDGTDRRLTWRRGATWRVWGPDGRDAPDRTMPALQGADTAAALGQPASPGPGKCPPWTTATGRGSLQPSWRTG